MWVSDLKGLVAEAVYKVDLFVNKDDNKRPTSRNETLGD